MIIADPQLNASTLSSVVEYLAQRTHVCAKVLSPEGEVVAINRHGLELLGLTADEVCGKVWTDFWDGEYRTRAEAAVAAAFEGRAGHFAGSFGGGDASSTWEVEVFACDWEEDTVSRVLVLSTPVTMEPTGRAYEQHQQLLAAMKDTLHAIINLSSATTSAANLLRRGLDETQTATLADALEDSGTRAMDTVAELRTLLDPAVQGK